MPRKRSNYIEQNIQFILISKPIYFEIYLQHYKK